MDDDDLQFAAQAIREAERVVALTGAGVSTASGVPDFRGDDGLWRIHDPEDFQLSRFEASPSEFWRARIELDAARHGEHVTPNPAHEALSDLESRGSLDALVTQNIDGLHTKAGSEHVIELHGSGERVVCRDCGRRFPAAPVRERVRAGETPPHCVDCGGVLKPDVVLFGEQLPQAALLEAHALAETADVFLVVGSSLSVEPAASLPETAAAHGATMVVVNLDPTSLSGRIEYDFRTDAAELLPRLAAAVDDAASTRNSAQA